MCPGIFTHLIIAYYLLLGDSFVYTHLHESPTGCATSCKQASSVQKEEISHERVIPSYSSLWSCGPVSFEAYRAEPRDSAHPAASERRSTIAGRRLAYSNSSTVDPCSLASKYGESAMSRCDSTLSPYVSSGSPSQADAMMLLVGCAGQQGRR